MISHSQSHRIISTDMIDRSFRKNGKNLLKLDKFEVAAVLICGDIEFRPPLPLWESKLFIEQKTSTNFSKIGSWGFLVVKFTKVEEAYISNFHVNVITLFYGLLLWCSDEDQCMRAYKHQLRRAYAALPPIFIGGRKDFDEMPSLFFWVVNKLARTFLVAKSWKTNIFASLPKNTD